MLIGLVILIVFHIFIWDKHILHFGTTAPAMFSVTQTEYKCCHGVTNQSHVFLFVFLVYSGL